MSLGFRGSLCRGLGRSGFRALRALRFFGAGVPNFKDHQTWLYKYDESSKSEISIYPHSFQYRTYLKIMTLWGSAVLLVKLEVSCCADKSVHVRLRRFGVWGISWDTCVLRKPEHLSKAFRGKGRACRSFFRPSAVQVPTSSLNPEP